MPKPYQQHSLTSEVGVARRSLSGQRPIARHNAALSCSAVELWASFESRRIRKHAPTSYRRARGPLWLVSNYTIQDPTSNQIHSPNGVLAFAAISHTKCLNNSCAARKSAKRKSSPGFFRHQVIGTATDTRWTRNLPDINAICCAENDKVRRKDPYSFRLVE